MRIHFTGIAGAGMSAAALMMRDAGHEVSGSDEDVFPTMSTYVEGLGFPFSLVSVLRLIPRPLRDPLYELVARNRYRIGGRRNACFVPAPEHRGRFIA